MSSSGISISDMQNFAVDLGSGGGNSFDMSSSVGNIIELGGGVEDLGDDLGAGLLSNSRVSSSSASSSSSSRGGMGSQNVSALEPIGDIGILEPLESISFDLAPSSSSSSSMFPDISVTKDPFSGYGGGSSGGDSGGFSNSQSATGPSITLAAAPRMSQEEEKKRKTDLINKLNRLEGKGYSLTKRFSMDNSLEEIQQEYDRLVDAKNLEASLRFQRQCLMGVTTGMEMLNNKFDPFGWELDGWAESIHENIEDFDEVFEELYDKYKGRGNMPPEVKLMMSLVGSGFMFHMSNSFFRNKVPNPENIFKQNPELARQYAAAAAHQAGPGFGNFMGAAMGVPQQQPVPIPPQQPQGASYPTNTGAFYQSSSAPQPVPLPQVPQPYASSVSSAPQARREMKGPSGVDDILKTFQEVREIDMNAAAGSPAAFSSSAPVNLPPTIFTSQPAMQAAAEISSLHSTPMSEISVATTQTSASTAQRARGGRRKAVAPASNVLNLNL